jgi:exonuclease III
MDILQWNVNGLHTCIPKVYIIQRSYVPAVVCLQETHFRLADTTSIRSCTSYWYDHLAGGMENGGTAYTHVLVLLQSTIQAVAVQLFMAAIRFTICSMYLPSHTIVTLVDLQDLLFQLPSTAGRLQCIAPPVVEYGRG